MTLSGLIQLYRLEHNISQRQFANLCNLSNGYISMLEKGINPKTKQPVTPTLPVLQKLAQGMGISLTELFAVVEDMPVDLTDINETSEDASLFRYDNLFMIERKEFPLLGNIACGTPIFADENFSLYVETGSAIQADFCLKAKGDSMIGARINDGDIVFIRKQDMVENGEIAAVLIGDEATLKRVRYDKDNNELLLFAENPNYQTLRYTGEELDHIRIIGKAVAFQSDLK